MGRGSCRGVPEEAGFQPALEQVKISQARGKRQEFQVGRRTWITYMVGVQG